jgi:hypothetical protein
MVEAATREWVEPDESKREIISEGPVSQQKIRLFSWKTIFS